MIQWTTTLTACAVKRASDDAVVAGHVVHDRSCSRSASSAHTRNVGVQTGDPMLAKPSVEALRMCAYRQRLKVKEEAEVKLRCAQRRAEVQVPPDPAAVPETAKACPVPPVRIVEYFNFGSGRDMAAKLVPTVDGGFEVKQLRTVEDHDSSEGKSNGKCAM
eukprot:4493697-Pleurochrysis_carterae.AAC.1